MFLFADNYNYFRDYDPGIGRYSESDPIGIRGGLTTFGYASATPMKWIDPKGLAIWLCTRAAFQNSDGAAIGNHSYMWNDRNDTPCGKEQFFGVGGDAGHHENGPPRPGVRGDSCVKVDGSDGFESQIMSCCEQKNKSTPWIPFASDCYNVANDCVGKYVNNAPKPPGGRFKTDCDSCWKPKVRESSPYLGGG